MAPTIREVARRAGVSPATVSRVVNANGHAVSGHTRERVLRAVRTLGYAPHPIARGLRTRTTQTIGLIVPDIANPFYPALARGVEDAARRAGYTVVLCNTDERPGRERAYLDLLRRRLVDGFVFATVGANLSHVRQLRHDGIPVVLVARSVPGSDADAVVVDNEHGGYLAARHLIELGHRRIAHLGGPSRLQVSRDRLRGYRRAIEEAGLRFDPSLVAAGAFRIEAGGSMMTSLLRRRPTAVFAANDLIAIGALSALRDAGRSVPADVAVVGFDDIPYAALAAPPLTTVAQPARLMGALASERLLARLRGEGGEAHTIVLEPELVVRASSGGEEQRLPKRRGGGET